MLKKLIISILSWLVYHANKLGKNENFYIIKNSLLKKYGTHVCYDVQFIEGVKCLSCKGTGVHNYYNFHGEIYDQDFCWHCYMGWYKRPTWNILARVKFGKYEFHQPYSRTYEKPDNSTQIINGYIEHEKTKYSKFALNILFIIYEKGFIKRWYKEMGNGYRIKWYLPRNYAYNLIHFIKHGVDSYPLRRLKRRPSQTVLPLNTELLSELPF